MIYLDNASTTELSKKAQSEILKTQDFFWNPSTVYKKGLDVKNKIVESKKSICNELGVVYNDNLIFTASATEANNLAIFGSVKKTQEQLLFSSGEHPSVYNCAIELKSRGYNVEFIPLTSDGVVDIEELKRLLQKPTAFVSIMHVSNETGAINDIKKIASLVKKRYPNSIIHCDGVQAFGKISVKITNLGVDLYTISGHKIHGPKGIGALYVKNIQRLKPIIFGGGQEFGIRSGTENTQYIFALAEVVKDFNIKKNYNKTLELNQYVRSFFDEIIFNADFNSQKTINSDNLNKKIGLGGIVVNSPESGSPYILNCSFEGVRGETLVHMLEEEGVIVGTGSACSSKKGALNRVLESMGKSRIQNEGSIRISFSKNNTLDEVKVACKKILEVYKKLLNKVAY